MSDFRQNIERARMHMSIGTQVPDGARFSFAKRLVLRLARVITAEQGEFNRSALAVLETLEANQEALGVQLDSTRRSLLLLQANLATDEVSRAMATEPPGPEGSAARAPRDT